MSTAKKSTQRKRSVRSLSPDAKGVYVPMTPERLLQLDADRAKLGMSRGGALAALYDNLGEDAVSIAAAATAQQQVLAQQQVVAEAGAKAMEPLIDALQTLGTAWVRRANQRQAIGVHTNQIAKLANVDRLLVRDGGQVSEQTLESLVLALQGIARRLDEQAVAEGEDDQLVAAVRALVEQARSAA